MGRLESRSRADVCYKPKKFLTPEAEARRADAWARKLNTAHDPVSFTTIDRAVPASHPTYAANEARPLQEPVLNKRGRQLLGVDAY